MARKIIEKIEIKKEVIEYIQRLYEDYKAKQDLLTMIFEIHKEDDNDTIITSKPFQKYEKMFAESKIAFDTGMKVIQDEQIPEKYKSSVYNFEVNFVDNTLDIYTV